MLLGHLGRQYSVAPAPCIPHELVPAWNHVLSFARGDPQRLLAAVRAPAYPLASGLAVVAGSLSAVQVRQSDLASETGQHHQHQPSQRLQASGQSLPTALSGPAG